MKRIFTHFFVAVLLMLSTTSWAQLSSLEVGQIYRFESARGGRSLRADGVDDVHTKTTDLNDKAQEWYVTKDGDYYVLRNVACGRFLKGAPSAYTAWSLTEDYSANENKFSLLTSNSTLNTLKTKGSDNYGHMHDDNNGDNGGYNVVGWTNDATGTHWTITKVNYTSDKIKELLEAAPTTAEVASYSTALNALFNDGAGACVAPKLSSLNAAKATSEYQALPTGLKAMVDKVYGDAWAEDNADNTKDGWESIYAKKFRVQMYEPYSIAGDITSWLGINSHANNDNPTGIYMPAAGNLYVMVEGEIKEGATLRLVDGYTNRRINGTTTENAIELRPGLNIINYTGATGMLYICYNVDTYNPNGATHTEKFPRKLSEFAPLKIHIEGGAINGFYNACGDFRATTDAENLWKTYTGANVDADADWEYMETRANLSILPILGHREILLLQLEDEQGSLGLRSLLPEAINCPSTPYSYAESWADYGMGCDPSTGKINIVMEAWDRIFYSQLATMGLVSNSQMEKMNDLYPRWTKEGTRAEMYDYKNKSNIDNKTYLEFCQGIDYSEYFNHHGIILGTSSGNPYGAGDHVGYPIGGFGAAVYDLPNTAGSTWGPAHEIGHQHQGLFTLNGLTEVTNNLFSNISLWYKGMSTSRYNGSDGSLESVLNAFNTNGSDIYTNNIWALTHLYYRLWLYYHLAGNNTQFYPRLFELLRNEQMQKGYNVSGDVSTLHFYKLACRAAGEDLTEFFRAHGYFSVMEDRFVGDYSNSIYNVSQAMIDAAIAEVKAMRDAEGNPLKENLSIIFINDDDENATYLQHDGKAEREIYFETKSNSDFGSVTDFIAGNVPVETTYTATLSDNGTITMSGGEGGVGFLIVNEKGEIISFSNKATFALSDKAMEAIVSGNATIKAVDSQSNVVEAEVNLTALQKGVLGALISKAQSIVDKVDNTYTKIGYFKEAAVAGLESSLKYAKEVYAGSSGYEAAYDLLYAEYAKVLENKDAKIPFNPSLTYIIKNKAYSNETMWVNGSGVVRSEGGVDKTSDDAKWKFVETSTAGVYNICTLNNKYIPAVQQSASMNATSDKADNDALYTLEEVADGVWAIKLSPAAGYRNLHSSWSNVVGWETGVDASRWYLTAVEAEPVIADLADLEVYINKTEQLLNEVVGTVTYTKGTPLTLQTTTQGSVGYLWSNAPEDSEGSISYLVDGTTGVNANYFHTEWSSEPPSGSHYLAVYLGEDNDLSSFTFSHTTRSGASADFPKSVDVYGSDDNVTYKYIGSASGMPQSAGESWEFNGVMQSSYKYLRFNYHASRGYWHMAEFDITPVTGFTATVNDVYNGTVSVDAVTAAMNALHNGKRTANSISPTTDDIDVELKALESAYKTLYGQYEATIDARKATLAQLADETEALMNGVGTVTLAVETPITLTTSNFYCNAPYIATQNADYSADYVTNLTDNNSGTYLHTRWNTNSDDGDYHYLRVDAGETTPIDLFYFTYTTASRGKKDMPLTMVVEGANEIDASNSTKDTFTEIATLTPLPEVLNTNTVYESSVLGSVGTKYRYLRFKVTDITAEEDDKNGHPFFTMSEFGLTSVTEENVTVNNAYKSCVTDELLLTTVHTTNSSNAMSTNDLVTSVPLLDAQIADQQAAKAALEEAMAKVIVDKTALQSLYDNALVLYGEMADTEGYVNSYYEPSALTNEKLAEAKTALDAAKGTLDNSNSQTEVDDAKDALQAQYDALLEIKNCDVTGRDELNALIGDMQSLLGEVADKTTAKTAITLQATDANADFYIWSNAKASDCDGTGASALIDKNDDGTAKTGTFFGTVWQGGAVPNYSHYITVDLGTEIALSELSIDYTTRNSTHANQRPTSIKVLGSNDKEGEYAEITILSEGMPVGQNQKWEMTSTVALDNYYRYIRFAPATEVGFFNMSDFNLYAHSAVETKDYYLPSGITGAQLFAMNAALLAGVDARDKFVTEENYNAALKTLQTQYNALLAIKNANVTDKSDLEDLKNKTIELINEVATVVTTETPIAMQCTNPYGDYYLYCNAEGKSNYYDGDDTGVRALLDVNPDGTPNTGTFLHTTYYGNDYDADIETLGHYLRLDMGVGNFLRSFRFNYVGRDDRTGNAPETIVVEGSNDLNNFDVITKITGLPSENDATYASVEITNGKAYRYIRFRVTSTHDNGKYKGHPFFALSTFEITACEKVECKDNVLSPLVHSAVAEACYAVGDATAMEKMIDAHQYVGKNAYNSVYTELQAAYDELSTEKVGMNLPVILTTDVNNPVLYKIEVKSNGNVFEYRSSDGQMFLSASADEKREQAWYFMQGDNADSDDDIVIMPYVHNGVKNTDKKVGYANNSNGTNPSTNSVANKNWYITFTNGKTTEGWWNLQPEDGKTNYSYLNQKNGSTSTELAFWTNENNPNDPGSQFHFVLDDTEYLSDAYYSLRDTYDGYSGVVSGTLPGNFTAESVDAFNEVYQESGILLDGRNASDDAYNAAKETLVNAYNSLAIVMPDPAKFYALRCNHESRYIYVNSENKMQWASSSYNKMLSNAIWQFVAVDAANGIFKMKSLHTDSYMLAVSNNSQVQLGVSGVDVTIVKSRKVFGAVEFATGNGNIGLHAHGSENRVIGYSNEAGANHYFFEEITPTDIYYRVSMKAEYSSVMLGYPAEVPDSVEAYDAVGIDGAYVDLVPVNGVIPANTPVILKRTDNEFGETKVFKFKYTNEASAYSNEKSSLLGGSLYLKYVACDEKSNYYKLMIKTGDTVARMYHMYKEFDENGYSYGSSDAGGRIKCSANKIYMCVPELNKVASYSLRVIENGVTGVDEVGCERGEDVIYDLQGRKVTEVTSPGFYIVNGKKVYVR